MGLDAGDTHTDLARSRLNQPERAPEREDHSGVPVGDPEASIGKSAAAITPEDAFLGGRAACYRREGVCTPHLSLDTQLARSRSLSLSRSLSVLPAILEMSWDPRVAHIDIVSYRIVSYGGLGARTPLPGGN